MYTYCDEDVCLEKNCADDGRQEEQDNPDPREPPMRRESTIGWMNLGSPRADGSVLAARLNIG